MVPNERPPFMPSPSANGDLGPEDGGPQRHPGPRLSPSPTGQMRLVEKSDSNDSLKRSDESIEPATTDSSETSNSDVTVLPRNQSMQPEYYQGGSSSHDRQAFPREIAHAPAAEHQHFSRSDSDTNDTTPPKRIAIRGGKGDHSPPLTGKDSAYSSVSGGSFASPTAALPRSASAQSSYPRAQFGLFPSSMPSTPKHSVSSRHGAMSPALSSPRPPEQQPVYPPVQRAQTSLDNYNSSSRRLLKKSSLSSLKRLFSKKKHGGVDTIAE